MTQTILASRSKIRMDLLKKAGVVIEVSDAKIDEGALISSALSENLKPRDIADLLAEYKARRVSENSVGPLVIGCDQVLVCEETLYQKPHTLDEARLHLLSLRGKTHHLFSAAVIYENGQPVWRHTSQASLKMRAFTDGFLDDYLRNQGDAILSSVGCYKLEEQGVQMFDQIKGDYFTILGLPLLEILGYLRTRGVIKN